PNEAFRVRLLAGALFLLPIASCLPARSYLQACSEFLIWRPAVGVPLRMQQANRYRPHIPAGEHSLCPPTLVRLLFPGPRLADAAKAIPEKELSHGAPPIGGC